MDEKALGKKLQLARRRAGLTQQELCQKANLSYSTLAKIERGAIRSPSIFTVAAIAGATNTPLEDLVDAPLSAAATPSSTKKQSKSGVRFVYFDLNGVLVRFFNKAFTQIADQTHVPVDAIETLFWRYDGEVCSGKLPIDEINAIFAKELDIPNFDWRPYYMDNVEPLPGIKELAEWANEHFEIGLLTDTWPGFIEELKQRGTIPNLPYVAVVDSSKVGYLKPDPKIFKIAEELSAKPPSEILLIDDDRKNLMEADKLGWHVTWFNDYEPEESISRAKEALEF